MNRRRTAPARESGDGPQRRDFLGENPEQTILIAASKLFSLKGVHGTKMTDIAREVGIRGPSLYYYFADRQEMLKAIAGDALSSVVRFIDEESARREASTDRLYLILWRIVDYLVRSPFYLHCIFDQEFRNPEYSDIYAYFLEWQRKIDAELARGASRGELTSGDIALSRIAIVGLIESSITHLQVRSLERSARSEAVATHIAGFALRGIVTDFSLVPDAARTTAMIEEIKAVEQNPV
jgi:AcrR family transcriptional regulator